MKGSKSAKIALSGMMLAVIFGVPLTQALIDVTGGSAPQCLDLLRQPPTDVSLRRYESDLEANSWFEGQVRPLMQAVEFVALRNLGEKAMLGRNGWLFYKPDVQYLVEPCAGVDEAVGAIVAFRDALAARDIKLLCVPTPGKGSVYPDMLTRRAGAGVLPESHTRRLVGELRRNGVEVVDLFEVFGRIGETPLYLRQDTHWSPAGMRLAAAAAAQRLLELGWVARGDARYDAKVVEVVRHGDVVNMVQNAFIAARFDPERLACTRVVDAATGAPYADAGDSPVLVMGDSFLRIYERDEPRSGGFVAHLARELGMPLTSIINDGGASTLVRQELYRKPELLAGKRVVVWEFVERDVRFGTEGWQHVPLPALAGGKS